MNLSKLLSNFETKLNFLDLLHFFFSQIKIEMVAKQRRSNREASKNASMKVSLIIEEELYKPRIKK